MKLANLSQHPLANVFLARGRQWLARAKPFRRKTEVLPPDAALTPNPCYAGTLAMYAKGLNKAGDSVTVLDAGQQLVCNAVGNNSTTGSFVTTIEYLGDPATATLTRVSASTVRLVVRAAGVEVVNKVVSLIDDLPAGVSGSGYGKSSAALLVTSRGVAWRRAEESDDAARYTAYWLDGAAVVAAAVAATSINLSSVVGTPVIDDIQSPAGVGNYTFWIVDGVVFLRRDEGSRPFGSGTTYAGFRVVSEYGLEYSTTREIINIEYECVGTAHRSLESTASGAPPPPFTLPAYDYQFDIWIVTTPPSGVLEEYHVGFQRFYKNSPDEPFGSEQVEFSYPVYRGGSEPNVVAHYTFSSDSDVSTADEVSATITINGALYTYDVLPDSPGDMKFIGAYDSFYAGKVLVGDTEVDALVCVNTPTAGTHKGYIAAGNTLVSAPAVLLADKVCGLNGSITLTDTGTLELKLPYRTVRKV